MSVRVDFPAYDRVQWQVRWCFLLNNEIKIT
jgi:hypothetical protein